MAVECVSDIVVLQHSQVQAGIVHGLARDCTQTRLGSHLDSRRTGRCYTVESIGLCLVAWTVKDKEAGPSMEVTMPLKPSKNTGLDDLYPWLSCLAVAVTFLPSQPCTALVHRDTHTLPPSADRISAVGSDLERTTTGICT